MARPAGTNVHVGKAAAIIVVALALGFVVLNDKGSGGFSAAAAARAAARANHFTETTQAPSRSTTSTTAAAERQPAQIKVIAINATGKAGTAGKATTRLRDAGYNALAPGNATASVTATHPASVIYVVTPGYEREAKTIASLFSLPDSAVRPLPNPSPSTDIRSDTNIAVLVGTGIAL
ncbi:MAG TPA: LytR C-terminal domain-containing protein [Acidimicrobiales bacterium]|nr:LytR C-terminal domain-containing protein [Acidimicrobiales bacterium]